MAAFLDLITARIVTYLEAKLITEVDEDDDSRATLVRRGRLQTDPTKAAHKLHVLIQDGDPEASGWRHEELNVSDNTPFGREWNEIGGGTHWVRRLSIEYGAYMLGMDKNREAAWQTAQLFIARIGYYVNHINYDSDALANTIRDTEDEFGERYVWLYPVDDLPIEGGGPPKDLIWRGRLRFDVLTYRPAHKPG